MQSNDTCWLAVRLVLASAHTTDLGPWFTQPGLQLGRCLLSTSTHIGLCQYYTTWT